MALSLEHHYMTEQKQMKARGVNAIAAAIDRGVRWCYVVLDTQRDKNGFIPSAVAENVPGHTPMMGNGLGALPWYWGSTIDEAERVCAKVNADRGLSDLDVAEIVASSIRR